MVVRCSSVELSETMGRIEKVEHVDHMPRGAGLYSALM